MDPHLVAALEAARECEAKLDAWWREQLVGSVVFSKQLDLFVAARKLRADLEVMAASQQTRLEGWRG